MQAIQATNLAMGQNQNMTLGMKLAPQMRLMMRYLAMPVLELRDEIKNKLDENPALEETNSPEILLSSLEENRKLYKAHQYGTPFQVFRYQFPVPVWLSHRLTSENHHLSFPPLRFHDRRRKDCHDESEIVPVPDLPRSIAEAAGRRIHIPLWNS